MNLTIYIQVLSELVEKNMFWLLPQQYKTATSKANQLELSDHGTCHLANISTKNKPNVIRILVQCALAHQGCHFGLWTVLIVSLVELNLNLICILMYRDIHSPDFSEENIINSKKYFKCK